MVITTEVKTLIEQVPFVPITTVSGDGTPHLIVVGKVAEVRDDDVLAFSIYKMETTQVILASTADGPKGYRLSGEACIEDNKVLFKAEKADSLM